jgi:hypothetical protein
MLKAYSGTQQCVPFLLLTYIYICRCQQYNKCWRRYRGTRQWVLFVLLSRYKISRPTFNSVNVLGLHVDYPIFFVRFFSRSGFYRQILINVSNIKFHENPSTGSRVDTSGRTWRIFSRINAEVTKICVRDTSLYHARITQLFSHVNANWCPRSARKRIPNKCKICSADSFVHCVSKYNV